MTHHIRAAEQSPTLTGPLRALPWADEAVCATTDPELNWWPVTPALIERFHSKVAEVGECWEWQASRKPGGYGQWYPRKGSPVLAHRYAAMLYLRDWHPSLDVCHRCDNPPCVRPDHLFMGDARANARDMAAKGRAPGQSQTTCIHGHPFDFIDSEGRRRCRTCARDRNRRYDERRRAV